MTATSIVVSGFLSTDAVSELTNSHADIIALDLPAMQACRFAGVSYLTAADFYSTLDFRRDFNQILERCRVLLEELDRKYAAVLEYPRSFHSNIYSFSCHLADLYYLAQVACAVNKRYPTKSVVVSEEKYGKMDDVDLAINCNMFENQLFRKSDASQYNLRRFFLLIGSPRVQTYPFAEDQLVSPFYRPRRFRRDYLLQPRNWGHLWRKLRNRLDLGSILRSTEKIIWCIQDGFEVDAVKRYLREFTFTHPLAQLCQQRELLTSESIPPFYEAYLPEFVKLFPEWSSELTTIFQRYHSGVVCYTRSVLNHISRQIDLDRPVSALYAIGAIVPLEDLYAWALNKKRVQIYYLQHGAANVYYRSPMDAFIERNWAIDKKMFFVSKREEAIRRKEKPDLVSETTGSIRLYEAHRHLTSHKRRKTNGRILYVQGRCPSEMWKNLFCAEGEDLLFLKHERLFSLIAKYGLCVDFKLFQESSAVYGPYFGRFIERYSVKDASMLDAVPAELVASRYDAIIMEYIGSALNAFFMTLDRPVIYYLFDREIVNPEIIGDFYQRHYVAHDEKDLDTLFKRYRQGTLNSKYSEEFVDRYVYPLDAGNPGLRISQILRSTTCSQNGETGARGHG